MTYTGIAILFVLVCVALGARGDARARTAAGLAAAMVAAQAALFLLQ